MRKGQFEGENTLARITIEFVFLLANPEFYCRKVNHTFVPIVIALFLSIILQNMCMYYAPMGLKCHSSGSAESDKSYRPRKRLAPNIQRSSKTLQPF
jgi:hypothetical protein